MIKVLLVDDHAIVRQGYIRLISMYPDLTVCGEAKSGESGYSVFIETNPDVVITDLSMQGISGMTLLQKILNHNKSSKVIVCSMYDNSTLVTNAITNGARGFVSKSADPLQIIDAINAVYKNQIFLSDGLFQRNTDFISNTESDRIKQLSTREFEIFKLLAEGKTISACAQILNVSEKTVLNNQTFIREKLFIQNNAELVHIALRNGIIKHFTDGS